MTDNAPERIWANPDHWIDRPPSPHCFRPFEYVEYLRLDLYTAVCADRDALQKDAAAAWDKCEERRIAQEAAETAIQAALERLDASLFTNAEHQQAKDILRGALKDKT